MMMSHQNVVAKGLHYHDQTIPSNPIFHRCVAVIDPDNPNSLPQIELSHIFSNFNNARVLSIIIVVDRYRFLIKGYLDFELPPNPNLLEIFPHLGWHGELMVFSLGRRGRPLSQLLGPRHIIRKAVILYVRIFSDSFNR